MSQVKEVSVRIINFDKQETSLNFSNCDNIEILNFDFGLINYSKFRNIIINFFNKSKTDLILPHIFKEESSSDDDDDHDYRREEAQNSNNHRSGARSASTKRTS